METDDLLKAIQRYWWLVLIMTLALAYGGYYQAQQTRDLYVSSTRLKLGQVTSELSVNGQQNKRIDAAPYIELVSTDEFSDVVADKVTKKNIDFHVQASQAPNSFFLKINVLAGKADLAQKLADASAMILVSQVTTESVQNVKMIAEIIEPEIKKIDENLRKRREELFSLKNKDQVIRLPRSLATTSTRNTFLPASKTTSQTVDEETRIAGIQDDISVDLDMRRLYTSYINRLTISNLVQSSDLRTIGVASRAIKQPKNTTQRVGIGGALGFIISVALVLLADSRRQAASGLDQH